MISILNNPLGLYKLVDIMRLIDVKPLLYTKVKLYKLVDICCLIDNKNLVIDL